MSSEKQGDLIWPIAELLRGDYKQADYGKVILPFTLLRRLDCVLAPTKAAVLAAQATYPTPGPLRDYQLTRAAGLTFYNTSPFDFQALRGDPNNLLVNLLNYIEGFSENARDIFTRYDFEQQLHKLAQADLLYQVVQRFASVDLSPQRFDNTRMGAMFEELIRRFAELSNETAGEHFTPREVIDLMVDLLLTPDGTMFKEGVIRRVYDPCAGSGGMLAAADKAIHAMNPDATVVLFGQELNDESYAICKADLMIKGHDVQLIAAGNTLSNDGHAGKQFDYMLSNPPYGVEWKKVEQAVRREHQQQGEAGRFGPGLPRVSDGSLLFLLHMLAKMNPATTDRNSGCRIAIVLNGSPLFTGGAGSGESNIRKWIIEHDWLEAIIALPTDMFYNTGIATYIWLLTNRKEPRRQGKIQLIDGTSHFRKMRKSLGSKRKELGPDDIHTIVNLYAELAETAESKTFDNAAFGYRTITVERPLRDEQGEIVRDRKGQPKADSSLRDTENVPLTEDVAAYFAREVLPHVPDAWIDESKTKVGYEIPFTRHFYTYTPPRPLAAIDADLQAVNREIMALLSEVTTP